MVTCVTHKHEPPHIQVLALILIIPAAATQRLYIASSIVNLTHSAAGWLLFVAAVTILLEINIVAIRFLSFGLVEKYTLPLVITVSGG